MDQSLLRSYFATAYELPTEQGDIRASIDGDLVADVEGVARAVERSVCDIDCVQSALHVVTPTRQ